MLGREELSCLSAPRVGLRDGRPPVVVVFSDFDPVHCTPGSYVQVARSSFALIE